MLNGSAKGKENFEAALSQLSGLVDPLLNWYREHRRDLPWRRERRAYHVWLSEIMLQQTRVDTALPYFERFLERYPRLEDLARSEEDEVLSLWSGLGYYNRARNLRKAAQIVCERFDGKFPREYQEALKLPGIGRYTAGAILSIAYDVPLPILDGNIRRVLARVLALSEVPPELDKQLWAWLEELVQDPLASQAISEFNQSLMELGALICLPRNPNCLVCPIASSCQARALGLANDLPRKPSQREVESLEFTLAVIKSNGRWLLRKSEDESFLKGFWEFPRIPGLPRPGAEAEFSKTHGVILRLRESFAPVRHQITFRKLLLYPLAAEICSDLPTADWRWAKLGSRDLPVASFTKKVAQRVQEASAQRSFRYNLADEKG